MAGRIFRHDTPLWRTLSQIADMAWLSLLMIASCLPVVTAGMGIAAGYDTARRRREAEVPITATVLWLVAGPLGAMLGYGWLTVRVSELLPLLATLTVLYMLVFPYIWALHVRFRATPAHTLSTAALLALGHLPVSLRAMAITAVLAASALATVVYAPAGLPVIVLLWPAASVMSHDAVLEPALRSALAEPGPDVP